MRIPADQWPHVPAQLRPKPLFVAEILAPDEQALLEERGWDVQDVRLLPNTSLAERQASVLAWFEGLKNGSLEPSGRLLDVLELEAKTCGLTNQKTQVPDKLETLDDKTVDEILDIKSRRAGMRLKA